MIRDPQEERVVSALRARGLLEPERRRLAPAWLAAAAVLLFAAGVFAGRLTMPTDRDLAAGHVAAPPTPALVVQAAGSAYIEALAGLSAEADAAGRAVGQEVVLSSLRGVVAELGRVDSTGSALAILRATVAEAERYRSATPS